MEAGGHWVAAEDGRHHTHRIHPIMPRVTVSSIHPDKRLAFCWARRIMLGFP